MLTPYRSLRNRIWDIPTVTEGAIDALVAGGASALSAPILAARGFAPETLEDFLVPKLRSLLPNPSFFHDMDAGADALADAIQTKKRIAIWSDYDVDGATSAAILGRYLRWCGVEALLRIPDRITEGYGPNVEGLLALQQDDGAEMVCILDAGTVAMEPLTAAAAANLPVIVVDHHAAEDTLPPAVAIINPNRKDQTPGYGHLCAAGMTFLFVIAVNIRLRKACFFKQSPDLMRLLDLVALGTICDVVPLTGLNRAFVMRGLPILSDRQTPGIAALAAVAKCPDAIGVRECGFALGPRINAGGRIGDSSLGARLLLEDDPETAAEMAGVLAKLNHDRQEMERSCTTQALEAVAHLTPGSDRQLAVAVVDAHEGVVGISAARVKEAVDAPAFVLAPTPEGTLKGSGRSVTGFDLGAAIIKARHANLLIKGGGHAMAGGLTLEKDQLEPFIAFMNAEIAQSPYFENGVISTVDMAIPLRKATLGLVEAVSNLAPFGMGNPAPRLVIGPVLLAKVQILKQTHLKLIFQDPDLLDAGPQLEGLMWNEANTPFATKLLGVEGTLVHALGGLEINSWNGHNKVQLKLEDVLPVDSLIA